MENGNLNFFELPNAIKSEHVAIDEFDSWARPPDCKYPVFSIKNSF